jgi:hypothetical protein
MNLFTIVVLSPPFQSNAEWQKLSKMWPSVMEWDGENKLVFAIFLYKILFREFFYRRLAHFA